MKRWLVRLAPWLITLLLLLFWVRKGGDLRDFRAVLAQANWLWLAGALLAQAAAYAAVAWLNELVLRHYRVYVPWFRQYTIQFAMSFVEAALPSLAVSGLLLRARLLKPYGASAAVATLSTLVETALISASVAAPALFVLGFELLDGSNNQIEPFTLLVGVGALLFVGWSLYALRASQRARNGWQSGLERLAGWWDGWVLARWPNHLAGWPSSRVQKEMGRLLGELGVLLRERPFPIATSLLLRTTCEALALLFCFQAFGVPISFLGWFLIYTITISINTLGAVPGGVGLAEVALATLYSQLSITPELAAAVALTYRVTGYWLPRLLGGLFWFWLERQHRLSAWLPEAEL